MTRLDELMTFCMVVEEKSFSRAAERLSLTQPAVSFQIKALEAAYGEPLLHRDSFQVTPTESGKVVYDTALQILRLYEMSKKKLADIKGEMRGQLLLGASTGPGEYLIPLLLCDFKKQYPAVDVSLRVGASEQVLADLLQHHIEVGFVGVARRDRHVKFEPFVEDELVLVVNPKHPWAKDALITLPDLLKGELILQQQGSGATAVLSELLTEYGVSISSLNVIAQLGLQESTRSAVKAGFGATIISRLGVIDDLRTGALVEVKIENLQLKRMIYLVYRRQTPHSNVEKQFIAFANAAVLSGKIYNTP